MANIQRHDSNQTMYDYRDHLELWQCITHGHEKLVYLKAEVNVSYNS